MPASQYINQTVLVTASDTSVPDQAHISIELKWFNTTEHFYRQIYNTIRDDYEYTKDTSKSLEFKHDTARIVNEEGYTHQQAVNHQCISLSEMRSKAPQFYYEISKPMVIGGYLMRWARLA